MKIADIPEVCVHQLLEKQAKRTPHATAVEIGRRGLTYSALDARTNQLARLLRSKGVGSEVLVGICLERSLEMLIAVLGVLKAGGAYIPLDPAHGKGRLQYILDEARVKVLITQESLLRSLPPTEAEIFCLDSAWGLLSQQSEAPVDCGTTPSNLAYVIYTSGSTGKPKGVQLQHRSVVNFLCSMREKPGLRARDVLLAVTTLSFDIAGLELFLPLTVGGKVIIASRQTAQDGTLLRRLLYDSGATVMQATPTTWRLLFEFGWEGDRNLKALVGGEAVPPDLACRLAANCREVWNMYGPTETTIWSSIYKVSGHEERNVPIGKPISNTSFYILDADRQPVTPGAEGELYIGGEGLARGYFERPQLSAEKFVPDPFRSSPGARMYRTGDLARCRPDGNFEFLGRIDHQVKIRGFRIELGEIEAVLEQHPSISQAIVVARESTLGDKSLAAYFIARGECEPHDLREHLRRQLPEYMLPSVFVRLREFPVTANGKVDRQSLPSPGQADYKSDRPCVAPRDETERELTALWEEALGLHPLGITDNFFELGGTSMQAARLFVGISRAFGKELPPSTLVHAPTVETLAREIAPSGKKFEYPTLLPLGQDGSQNPFFVVHGGIGTTLFLQRLAARLADRQCYGIEPDGLDGGPFRYRSMEQMAAFYISEIRKIQPKGPYYLGGYCMGGIVAFEMAQQLLAQGETIAALVLFSAPLVRRAPRPAVMPQQVGRALELKRQLSNFLLRPRSTLTRPGRRLASRMRYKLLLAFGRKIPQKRRLDYVAEALYDIELKYAPRPYPGKLIFFRGSNLTEFGPDLGWQGLAACLEHRIIGDGDYWDRRKMFEEPLVEETARILDDCLADISDDRNVAAVSAAQDARLS